MRVAVYLRSPHQALQALIARSVVKGCEKLGDRASIFTKGETRIADCDTVVMFGIGGNAREVYDEYRSRGKRVVFIDKGYTRTGHFRVSIDSFQPLSYFQRIARPVDRWRNLGFQPAPYARNDQGKFILFDGASNKYCAWNRLPDWQTWGAEIVKKIKQRTDLPIIYRPRPSQHVKDSAKPIDGTFFSQDELLHDLRRARIVISHGGNIGFDAVLAGRPHFAIDASIARPVSEVNWSKLSTPFIPDEDERQQWFKDVAYLQWDATEIADGPGWRYMRDMLDLPT